MSTSQNAAFELESSVRVSFETLIRERGAHISSSRLLKGIGNAEVIVSAGGLKFAISQHGGSFDAYLAPKRSNYDWNSMDYVLLAFNSSAPTIGPKYRSVAELGFGVCGLFDTLVRAFDPAQYQDTKARIIRAANRGVVWVPPLRSRPLWASALIFLNRHVVNPGVEFLFPFTRDRRARRNPVGADQSLENRVRDSFSGLFEHSKATVISNSRYRTLDHAIVALRVGSLRLRVIRDRGFLRVEIAPDHLPRDWWQISSALAAISEEPTAMDSDRETIRLSRRLEASLEDLNSMFSAVNYNATRKRLLEVSDSIHGSQPFFQ